MVTFTYVNFQSPYHYYYSPTESVNYHPRKPCHNSLLATQANNATTSWVLVSNPHTHFPCKFKSISTLVSKTLVRTVAGIHSY